MDRYRKGDHWVVDDRSGARIRASDSRMEWTGAIVHKDDWEPRHPQDFVRGVRDNQAVPNPRPVPPAVFDGPLQALMTADANAGATTITIDESARFSGGDIIGVYAGGTLQRLTVASVVDEFTLSLTAPLSGPVASGTLVTNFSAVAPANIG